MPQWHTPKSQQWKWTRSPFSFYFSLLPLRPLHYSSPFSIRTQWQRRICHVYLPYRISKSRMMNDNAKISVQYIHKSIFYQHLKSYHLLRYLNLFSFKIITLIRLCYQKKGGILRLKGCPFNYYYTCFSFSCMANSYIYKFIRC